MTRKRLLFLCTGNSCRSQMAEGFAKRMMADTYEIYSAGIEAHGMNPYAMRVMKEIGIDISDQFSKTIDQVPWDEMDVVITLCDHAKQTCPMVPRGARHIHWSIEDPAEADGDEETILGVYRRIRDEIKERIENLRSPT